MQTIDKGPTLAAGQIGQALMMSRGLLSNESFFPDGRLEFSARKLQVCLHERCRTMSRDNDRIVSNRCRAMSRDPFCFVHDC
jgi:hypothetical protein